MNNCKIVTPMSASDESYELFQFENCIEFWKIERGAFVQLIQNQVNTHHMTLFGDQKVTTALWYRNNLNMLFKLYLSIVISDATLKSLLGTEKIRFDCLLRDLVYKYCRILSICFWVSLWHVSYYRLVLCRLPFNSLKLSVISMFLCVRDIRYI